jgi:hypothetical protein
LPGRARTTDTLHPLWIVVGIALGYLSLARAAGEGERRTMDGIETSIEYGFVLNMDLVLAASLH